MTGSRDFQNNKKTRKIRKHKTNKKNSPILTYFPIKTLNQYLINTSKISFIIFYIHNFPINNFKTKKKHKIFNILILHLTFLNNLSNPLFFVIQTISFYNSLTKIIIK